MARIAAPTTTPDTISATRAFGRCGAVPAATPGLRRRRGCRWLTGTAGNAVCEAEVGSSLGGSAPLR